MSGSSADVVHAIAETVADREGVEPSDLPPLQTVVDCDALTALFDPDDGRTGRPPTRLEITYCDYEVVVTADGRVSAEPVEDRQSA